MIATVGNYSGVPGSIFGPAGRVVQVWASWINARGGVHGRPVKILVMDDGSDPSRHRAVIKDAVEARGAIAIVGLNAPTTSTASEEYLVKKRVPVIGGVSPDTVFSRSVMHFPLGPGGEQFWHSVVVGAARQLVPRGLHKLGILVCVEAVTCQDARRYWSDFGTPAGFEVVYSGQASVAQPDFTAECLAARNAGVEVFHATMDSNSIGRLAAACARQGFKPQFALAASQLIESIAQDGNLEGALALTTTYPFYLQDLPAAGEYHAALQQFAPNLAPGAFGIENWAAARLFEHVVGAVSDRPSSSSILDGLWKIDGETAGGLTPPLRYVRDKTTPQRLCWYNGLISQKQWRSPDGAALHCVD